MYHGVGVQAETRRRPAWPVAGATADVPRDASPGRPDVRIATVVGTRPQLIKLAALQPALRARHDEVLIDTGQHWDEAMAGAFFAELGLPRPDHSPGHRRRRRRDQTGRMLRRARAAPRRTCGRTPSSCSATRIPRWPARWPRPSWAFPVAHVEAGLRSFDRAMPEEINRVVADHLARWLFAPTPTAVANLAAEGITDGVLLVGDLMQDLAARIAPRGAAPAALEALPAAAGRPDARPLPLRDDPPGREPRRRRDRRLGGAAADGRDAVAAGPPRAAPGHARRARGVRRRSSGRTSGVVEPLGYRTSLAAQLHAAAVLTDSGGVQREAAWLGVPCLVLRDTTEWVEAVASSDGRMVLVGRDVGAGRGGAGARRARRRRAAGDARPARGVGRARCRRRRGPRRSARRSA